MKQRRNYTFVLLGIGWLFYFSGCAFEPLWFSNACFVLACFFFLSSIVESFRSIRKQNELEKRS